LRVGRHLSGWGRRKKKAFRPCSLGGVRPGFEKVPAPDRRIMHYLILDDSRDLFAAPDCLWAAGMAHLRLHTQWAIQGYVIKKRG